MNVFALKSNNNERTRINYAPQTSEYVCRLSSSLTFDFHRQFILEINLQTAEEQVNHLKLSEQQFQTKFVRKNRF